jgi:formylglycine-generating enzyme required for sulfatase activity
MAEDLRRYLADEPIRARRVGLVERGWKWVRRHPAAAGSVTAILLVIAVAAMVGWDAKGQLEAGALRKRLLEATTPEVPGIVRDMAPYRRWLDGPLREVYAEAEANHDSRRQLHASLALLPVDEGQVDYLHGRLLQQAGPEEVVVLREALRPYRGRLEEELWAILEDRTKEPVEHLRAAGTLAAYVEEDRRWEKVRDQVTWALAAQDGLVIGRWAETLRPIGGHLLPALARVLVEERHLPYDRRTLTGLFAGYAEGRTDAWVHLENVLREKVPPMVQLQEVLFRRQANAAVALAAGGRWDKVLPLLRNGPDPTLRSYLIARLGPGGVEAKALMGQFEREGEVTVRRALLLALGDFDASRLLPGQREALVPDLVARYRDDPDPGVHGAVGWLLGQWGQGEKLRAVDRRLASGKVEGGRQWYVNGQGQTMVVLPPEDQLRRPTAGWRALGKPVDHSFALAAREVTLKEFRRFRPKEGSAGSFGPTDDCPVSGLTWYDAVAYCNWLSAQEGIPKDQWCYLPNDKGQYAEGNKVPPDFLRRTGYRLPTGEEWEYACQAGSRTQWSMGWAQDLLPRYAWFALNSLGRMHPVGSLRPNDWGLFDMHGNGFEWCQSRFDRQEDKDVIKNAGRLFLGGAFHLTAEQVGSHAAVAPASDLRGPGQGCRPARTVR